MSLDDLFHRLKGSAYSGNYRHRGRPGKHGGSSPGGGHYAIGVRPGMDKKTKIADWKSKKGKPTSVGRNFAYISDNELLNHYKLSEKCAAGLDCSGITTYTGGTYQAINRFLREGSISPSLGVTNLENLVTKIDTAMNKAPRTPRDMITFRGFDREVFDKINPGTIFKDEGYYSTSIDNNVAKSFGSYIVDVRIPKGSKGVYVGEYGISKYPSEREFILPRGSRFKVISKDPDTQRAVVELIS